MRAAWEFGGCPHGVFVDIEVCIIGVMDVHRAELSALIVFNRAVAFHDIVWIEASF